MKMAKSIFNLLVERRDFFFDLLIEHLEISLVSIGIAIITGLLIGISISENKKSAKLSLGVINFIYTIPAIALLGFLIPFSGVGNTTAIITLSIYALLPMVRNTYTGIRNIDENILEAAKGMGSTRQQILFRIKLPLAMPVIMSAIRNMVTMTIALAGIASFIGAGGLGVAIYRGIALNNPAMTLIGSLLIAALAISLDWVLGFIENLMNRHQKTKKLRKGTKIGIVIFACIFIVGAVIHKADSQETINIATKPGAEQYILGEMLKALIEQETDLKVKLTCGLGGGTANIHSAMINGDFDIYPEYTGTAWSVVLKHKGVYNEDLFNTLHENYNKHFNMSWIGMYGFNNTYGLAVRKETALKYNLNTYSDLTPIAHELTFGAEYDYYERMDGYDAFCSTYGYRFRKTMDIDIALKYQAMNQGEIDAMNIFTTDGLISVSDIKILVDNKRFFPSYKCGNVIRNEVLDKHPQLKGILEKLTGSINETDMMYMNYQVEKEGKEPKIVAVMFLQTAGLLKNK